MGGQRHTALILVGYPRIYVTVQFKKYSILNYLIQRMHSMIKIFQAFFFYSPDLLKELNKANTAKRGQSRSTPLFKKLFQEFHSCSIKYSGQSFQKTVQICSQVIFFLVKDKRNLVTISVFVIKNVIISLKKKYCKIDFIVSL